MTDRRVKEGGDENQERQQQSVHGKRCVVGLERWSVGAVERCAGVFFMTPLLHHATRPSLFLVTLLF